MQLPPRFPRLSSCTIILAAICFSLLPGPSRTLAETSAGDAAAAATNLRKILAKRPPRPAAGALDYYSGGTKRTFPRLDRSNLLLANCQNDELEYLEIEKKILGPWRLAFATRDPAALLATLQANAKLMDFSQAPGKLVRTDGVIQEMQWASEALASVSEAQSQTKSLHSYLSGFSKIEDVKLSGLQLTADRAMRFRDFSLRRAAVIVRFDLRGRDVNGSLRQDRGTMKLLVEKMDREWKVASAEGERFETLTANQPAFQEITQAAGLGRLPTYLRTEAIRRGGYALATADFDGDGNLDLFVGARGPATLLRGDGKGKFTPVVDSGIGEHTLVKSALFADFSNTGRPDLLLVRFVPQENAVGSGDFGYKNDLVLYRNLGGGKFRRDDAIHSGVRSGHAMPLAAADFNKDGFTDFYVGFPGNKDFTSLSPGGTYASDVRVQGLFLSRAGQQFDLQLEKDILPGSFDRKTFLQRLFAHSALAVDFNQDNNVDILTVDDRGNLSPAYQNTGNGNFVQVAANIGIENNSWGMGVAAGDVDGDGILDLAITNVSFYANTRLNNSCRANWSYDLNSLVDRTPALRLFKGTGGGNFVEYTLPAGLTDVGAGLAGLEFVDFNGDGLQDIYVTNGLWTGTDRSQDLSSEFVRARPSLLTDLTLGEYRDKSSSAVMDILSHFRGDVSSGKPGRPRPSMAGFERNRLFRNDGNGKFTEVGYVMGVDSIADGYVVAKADIDGDGAQDLILRNADPGSEDVVFPTVQLYRNLNPYQNQSLRIQLQGTKSNRDGLGAAVTVTANGRTSLQPVVSNNGTIQSERSLFFGLGKNAKADLVEVKWPSGITQKIKNVAAGNLVIREER